MTDWAAADYYELLEVGPKADADQLKRAYRLAAQRHHPDANPGDPDAADRFRRVAEAYAVLSDNLQRTVYDRVQFKEYRSRTPDAPDMDAPGSASASGSILGRHIVTPVVVPLEGVVAGTTVTVEVNGIEPIEIDIPPGVDDGDIVRIEGKGHVENEVRGDVIVIIHIPRHAFFTREGDDISVAREVNVSDLALGVQVRIPTLHGPTMLEIPAGTSPGEVLTLPGFGVRHMDGTTGDLHVRIDASSGGFATSPGDKGSFSGLVDVLDDEHVEVIPTVGSPFNSDYHEVVGKVEPGEGSLVVTGEVRRGYLVKGQVIRPALVTVKRAGGGA